MPLPTISHIIPIKDATGTTKNLASDEDGGKLVPFHAIYGTVQVTSSDGEKLNITGSVNVGNFPNVQIVTASMENKLGITGTVNINNFPNIQTVTASLENRLAITGAVGVNNFPEIQQIAGTASINNLPLTQSVKNEIGNSVQEVILSSFIWNSEASGTFRLADINLNRKELFIVNASEQNLYIKISSTSKSDSDKHGFTLSNTSSAPLSYNFIVFPSGTYMSSEASRVLYHSGYFTSSSLIGTVVATSIE